MTTALAPALTEAALRRYVGVSESPAGSNRQQFSARCGRPPEAWCDDFQCCVFWLDLGFEFEVIGLPASGTASCAVHTGANKRAGWFSFFPRSHAWIHFGPGGGSHIGYVIAVVLDDGTVTSDTTVPHERVRGVVSIEGNTSAPNNYAGGTVAVHTRMFGPNDDIYGYSHLPVPAAPTEEDDVRPVVLIDASGQSKTGWLVMPTGSGLVKIAMGDAKDIALPPAGYGPPVEVDRNQLAQIPLTDGTKGAV
ncbi:MAG TPA: hypothetical protein VFA83_15755 [Acidimicrobiales bacterium]|nr:hypothetical protein [Acidimicrobiales bacterium]